MSETDQSTRVDAIPGDNPFRARALELRDSGTEELEIQQALREAHKSMLLANKDEVLG